MKMMDNFRELFFSPIQVESPVDTSYKDDLSNYIALLEAQAGFSNACTYMLDYVEGQFVYIPHHQHFLCGYSVAEVKRLGVTFFEKVLHPDDRPLYTTINDRGFEFLFNQIEPSCRTNWWATYDLRTLAKDGNVELHNFRFRPFKVDRNGNLLLAIVQVSLATNSKSGNFCIYSIADKQLWEYSTTQKKFVKKRKTPLSDSEKKVLALMAQGYTGKQIEKKLAIADHTYKYYQKSIFRKLNVSNGKEAIYLYTQVGKN